MPKKSFSKSPKISFSKSPKKSFSKSLKKIKKKSPKKSFSKSPKKSFSKSPKKSFSKSPKKSFSKSPYTKPKLREVLKRKVLKEGKGGQPGQWSARKAQLLASLYKKAGGGYTHPKQFTNAQQSLIKWTEEDWGTKSGRPSTQGKNASGERYLPRKARDALSKKEYELTSKKKKQDLARGVQFSKQPKHIAEKTRRYRL